MNKGMMNRCKPNKLSYERMTTTLKRVKCYANDWRCRRVLLSKRAKCALPSAEKEEKEQSRREKRVGCVESVQRLVRPDEIAVFVTVFLPNGKTLRILQGLDTQNNTIKLPNKLTLITSSITRLQPFRACRITSTSLFCRSR